MTSLPAPRPNIVLINCDDLGYGDLPPYGNSLVNTPHINQLAQDGMRFTSFYTCNSLCTPSRFGLLTGRYADRVGLGWVLGAQRAGHRTPKNSPWTDFLGRFNWEAAKFITRRGLMDYNDEPKTPGIPESEITLAQALHEAGYRTGMVGKWHLGEFPRHPHYHPRRHGFDFFYGVPHSNDMKDFALYRNEYCLSPDFTEMEKLTGLYTEEAINFIKQVGNEPFFLYFAHTYPHQPLHASENFRGKSKAGLYGDTIEEIDWSVGQLVQALKAYHKWENTLIVITSDNGAWYHGSPGPFRGRKGQSYEGGYRIPMIAHWPWHIRAGTVCQAVTSNLDWFPTCLALAGAPLPDDRIIDGKDISALLTGAQQHSPHQAFYYYHNESLEAIRVGKWKYIPKIHTYVWPGPLDKFWPSAGTAEAPWLYDLEADPSENYNLKDNYPDVLEEMQQKFRAWETHMKDNPGGWLS
jgi:arylsulfatase A-like enzyme